MHIHVHVYMCIYKSRNSTTGVKSNINKNVNISLLYPNIKSLAYSLNFESTGLTKVNELLNQMAEKVSTTTI